MKIFELEPGKIYRNKKNGLKYRMNYNRVLMFFSYDGQWRKSLAGYNDLLEDEFKEEVKNENI